MKKQKINYDLSFREVILIHIHGYKNNQRLAVEKNWGVK